MKAVRAGKVDVVLCYNLDRLGRSLSHLVQLLGEFSAHKVALIVPGQGINTSSSNPASALLLNMLGAIAQFEHSIIVERVNAGLAAARRRGIKLGRPGTLGVHREAVAKLRAQGRTGRAIAKELGIPSSSVFKLIAGLRSEIHSAELTGAIPSQREKFPLCARHERFSSLIITPPFIARG